MIYTEKKNPIYDTKTSSKPHTPYAIQMEVGRLKRVEVTGSWRGEFTAAWRSQRGSASLLHLLSVHFLRHGKSSLNKTSLHFLVCKRFLADPDQEFWVVNHFETLNSLGLLLFSLPSVQGDQQTKAPLPVHSAFYTRQESAARGPVGARPTCARSPAPAPAPPPP